MMLAEITLGGREWISCAVVLTAAALIVLIWAYTQTSYAVWSRAIAAILKTVGVVLLALLLLEPRFTGTRPRPGDNLFLVVADNSRSLQLADQGNRQTRGAAMKERLGDKEPWLTRLAQDFDVRRYAFDASLRP